MNILLIREANGVHYNLIKGLLKLGYYVKHMIFYGTSQGRVNDGSFAPQGKGIIGYIRHNMSQLITFNGLKQYYVINFINTITAVYGQYSRYLDLHILSKKAKRLSYYALGCDELNSQHVFTGCSEGVCECFEKNYDCMTVANQSIDLWS